MSGKSKEDLIVIRSIDLIFGLVLVFVNIAEIIILARKKGKRKIYECFLLSLSITDLLFGASKIAVSMFYFLAGNEVVIVIVYSIFIFLLSSIFHLSWISFHRFWAIRKPIHYRVIWTKTKVNASIVVIWLLSAGISILTLFMDPSISNQEEMQSTKGSSMEIFNLDNKTSSVYGNCTVDNFVITSKVEILFTLRMSNYLAYVILIADVIFIATNAAVVYIIQSKRRQADILNKNTFSKGENKASIVCVLIALIFVVLTLPYSIVTLIHKEVPYWMNVPLFFNSVLNSIIYFFRNKCMICLAQRKKESNRKHCDNNGNIESHC